jgi:outer membrane immunogenic protein
MKRLLVAGIVVTAFGVMQAVTVDVHAAPKDPLADFPYVPQPPPPLPPPPPPRLFSWTGCYLGADFGGGFADTLFNGAWVDPLVPSTFGPVPIGITPGSDNHIGTAGVLAGGQGGCDVQVAPHWVIGAAADGSWTNISGNLGTETGSGTFPGPTKFGGEGVQNVKTDTLATATARLGYAPYGNGLFYVKGGAAWEQSKYGFTGEASTTACATFMTTCTHFNPTVTQAFNFTANDSRMGWTAGVGTEWRLIGNWSFFGEYDYLGFGTRNVNFTDAVMGTSTFSVRLYVQEVKLGINYRFGTPLP